MGAPEDDQFTRLASVSDSQLDAEIAGYGGWQDLVTACQGDESIARVLVRFIGSESAIAWLSSRPPVLEGFSGAECLDTDEGSDRLREALMRFH